MIICLYFFRETIRDKKDEIAIAKEKGEVYQTYPDNASFTLVRFICGILLHAACQREFNQGITFMKFSLNHPYRFDNRGSAFISGLLQTTSVLVVESVNIVSIALIESYGEIV